MKLLDEILIVGSLAIFLWYRSRMQDDLEEVKVQETRKDITQKGITFLDDPLFFFRRP